MSETQDIEYKQSWRDEYLKVDDLDNGTFDLFRRYATRLPLSVVKLPPNYPQTTPKLETDAMILQTIQSTPDITKEELAKICKISIEGVRYQIRKLRKAGRIEWVGHSRTGRWVIKENKQNDIHTNDNIQ